MLQSLICRKIVVANRFTLEVVVIVQIKPLFTTMKTWSCTSLTACDSICRQNFSKKAFLDRVVSHFQIKVGSKRVLSGELKALGVVMGLDKAAISTHCYLSALRLLTWHQNMFLDIVCPLNVQ